MFIYSIQSFLVVLYESLIPQCGYIVMTNGDKLCSLSNPKTTKKVLMYLSIYDEYIYDEYIYDEYIDDE